MATVNLTKDTFKETVQQSGIVLIDWWAPWCGPCRAFAPIYETVSQAHPDVTFAKIDTEQEPELARAFEISAIPTLMVIRDGVLLLAQPGMLPQAALEDVIEQASKLDMKAIKEKSAEAPAAAGVA